jgi:hypothetical protein
MTAPLLDPELVPVLAPDVVPPVPEALLLVIPGWLRFTQ